MRRSPPRHGFTLLEMLCVTILLVMLAGVMALLLRETLEVQRIQAEGFDTLLENNALADQFRADVAQAESAPQKWQDYQAGPATLILQMRDRGHVIYLWQKPTLLRRASADSKVTERKMPVGGEQVDVEFVPAAASLKVVRLRLHALRKGSPVPGQVLEIAAALGGDWR